MATIKISPLLSKHTNFQEKFIIEKTSVITALEQLVADYPELQKYIFDADHDICAFINIYVNNHDIRDLDDINTKLEPQDELAIIPAVAGG